MRTEKGIRIDHKVVARTHPFAGGELKTVAARTNFGELFPAIRGEREGEKWGKMERRVGRRERGQRCARGRRKWEGMRRLPRGVTGAIDGEMNVVRGGR